MQPSKSILGIMEEVVVDDTIWPAWPPAKHRESSDITLQEARRETWIGLPVVVKRGKNQGAVARVIGTGSGWVRIRLCTPDGSDPLFSEDSPEASKRADDLHVVEGYQDAETIPQAPMEPYRPSADTPEIDLSDDSTVIPLGLPVRVSEGTYEGKVGRVVGVTPSSVWLAIRNATSLVEKPRNAIEISLGGEDADDKEEEAKANGNEGAEEEATREEEKPGREAGRSSRLVSRRLELIGKRVLITATNQTGVVRRVTASGGLIISLDDQSGETTKRKDEIQVVGEAEDEALSQQGTATGGGDVDSDREVIRVRNTDRRSRNSPQLARDGTRQVRRRREHRDRDLGAVNVSANGDAAEDDTGRGKRTIRRNTRNGTTAKRQREQTSEQKAKAALELIKFKRQEFIVGFVQRMKERMEKSMGMASRPDLSEWLDKIQGSDDALDVGDEDAQVPLLYDPPVCQSCFVEMETGDAFCWNPACERCPVFSPTAKPISETDPSALRRTFSMMQSPRKPGFIDYSALPTLKGNGPEASNIKLSDDNGDKEETTEEEAVSLADVPTTSLRKRQRMKRDMIFSPLVTFSFRANPQWLGYVKGKPQAPAPASIAETPGFFGKGWKSDLVFDEPGLKGGDQQDRRETSLDYRWNRGLLN